MSALRQYLDDQPRGSVAALAERLNISRVYLSQLVAGNRVPSATLAVKIERETGGRVSRQRLRDDWQDVWPELVGTEGAPPVAPAEAAQTTASA